jgi:quinol monooxygenase YgiN
MYGLQGRFTAQPGKGDDLAALLLEAANALGRLEECRLYVIGRIAGDPDAVLVYEVWDSAEAHRASLDREDTKAAIERGRPLIAGMSDRIEFEPAGGKGL